MSRYRILIVEDDVQIAESLSEILEILGHQTVGIAESYDDAIKILKSADVQLVLLDIQLKGDKSGIDIAEKIKEEIGVPFVFTTAYADKETIKKASMHGPYGYIVKPYGMKDISAGIEVAIQTHQKFQELKNGEGGMLNNESLFVKVNARIVRIDIKDLLFIEAKGDYAVFKTQTKGYIVQTTFTNVASKLDPSRFLKVHRSYIVNLEKVIDLEENNLLVGDQSIPVSRSQKAALLNRLDPL